MVGAVTEVLDRPIDRRSRAQMPASHADRADEIGQDFVVSSGFRDRLRAGRCVAAVAVDSARSWLTEIRQGSDCGGGRREPDARVASFAGVRTWSDMSDILTII